MTDGQPPPITQTEGLPPFDPFMLEPQKAHSSTESAAPAPMQRGGRRRMRIPGPLLGLLLALAVAVPVVAGTLQSGGEDFSDGESAPAVQSPTTADPGVRSGEKQLPQQEGPPPAVQDCVVHLPGLSALCWNVLGEKPEAGTRYLECRSAGLAADHCLGVKPSEQPPR